MTACLRVKDGGLSTTVQDLGRFGFQSLGIPVSGALDPVHLRLANALVGNDQGQGALEIRYLGPTLRVEADTVRVALAGTATPIVVREPAPRLIPSGQSVTLHRGDVFRVGAIADTACCYLAVAGGFDVAEVFGSQSTYARGGFGGLEGRAVSAGDDLPLRRAMAPLGPERALPRQSQDFQDRPIRIVLGPQSSYFSETGVRAFLNNDYTVSREADRMGLRLEGPKIEHSRGFNIPSDGIVTGAIQIPGTGLLIVLLADRQTTGGYPKIGCVISADLPRLGRLRPGAAIRFEAVGAETAVTLRRRAEADFARIIAAIEPLKSDAVRFEEALRTANLVSGGEWLAEENASGR